MKQKDLDQLQKTDVHPMNNLTIDEKLDLAIVMAESIADIHGFEGGVIVHVSWNLASFESPRETTFLLYPLHCRRLLWRLTGRRSSNTVATKPKRAGQT
jgi:hypothetical protein